MKTHRPPHLSIQKLALAAMFALSIGTPAFSATTGTYSVLHAPGDNPDANFNGNPIDAWNVDSPAGTGNYQGNISGTSAWGIYNTITSGGATISQTTVLQGGELTIGQTVSLSYAHNWGIASGQSVGINLLDGDNIVFSIFYTGGTNGYQYSDAGTPGTNTSVDFGATVNQWIPFSFTITAPETYSASFGTSSFTGSFTGSITGVQLFNAGAGDNSDQYSAALMVVPEPGTSGLVIFGALGAVILLRRRKLIAA